MAISLGRVLVIAFTLSCESVLVGQEKDPFDPPPQALPQASEVPGDPFAASRRDRESPKPVVLTFKVTAPNGEPLSEARVQGPGISRTELTDENGIAEIKVDRNILHWVAKRVRGPLRFYVVPKADDTIPIESRAISIADLLNSKAVSFQTRRGVRLSGRVVGKNDKLPLENVEVRIRRAGIPPESKLLKTRTDEQGNWSIVTARGTTMLTLSGQKEGYRLQYDAENDANYARVVRVREDESEIRVPDIDVEQIRPLKVTVKDSNGRSISGASTGAYRQDWLDDSIVMWESISRGVKSDETGTSLLFLDESGWNSAIVTAKIESDTGKLEGRAILRSKDADEIEVVVQPRARITGALRRDGEAASKVELVLYEATQNQRGDWHTIGVCDQTTTDERGNFSFTAPPDRRYMVATLQRDAKGVQKILYRTPEPTTSENYRVPDLSVAPQNLP